MTALVDETKIGNRGEACDLAILVTLVSELTAEALGGVD
jgi:hypothetical protein